MSGQKFRPDKNLILMGRIGAAHGLNGQVRINSFTQNPLAIGQYGRLFTSVAELTLEVENLRLAKNKKASSKQTIIIATLKTITTRTRAEELNGVELFVPREQLLQNDSRQSKDEFLHIDLIGLEARFSDGAIAGKVVALPNFGASDLIEIKKSSGQTILLPFTRHVVPDINIAAGFLTIVPPKETSGEKQETAGEN